MNKSTEIKPEILLVEDSPVEAEIARRILVKAGYRVRQAKNGAEGLQALRERPSSLVMSDVMMPLMSGYQLCYEIKHDEALCNIPVVLLTALSEAEDIIEAIKAGADSYINKPFVEDIALENIRSLLATPINSTRGGQRQAEQIVYNGKSHLITSDNQQILNLLLSVYRNTMSQNRELWNTRNQLVQLNDNLDKKVHERTAELQESESRTRTILNTALDAFVIMDSTGLVQTWNNEAERLFGYSREDVQGKYLAELIIPPNSRAAHTNGLMHFVETGEGSMIGGRVEVTAMRSDQSEFYAELSITVIHKEMDTFFSAFIRDITERKQAESKVTFLAFHDKLTGLPNRELFYDRLSHAISQAKRKQTLLAILFLDLDGFKAVNDNYGHEAGDLVLQAVSTRLKSCVRGIDTVARLGGDEFIILLSELDKPTVVTSIAEKIIQKLDDPIVLNNAQKCLIGVSIGIAIFPDDGYELDKLMSSADTAMYESKVRGKNTYTYFKEKKNDRVDPQPWASIDEEHLLGIPRIDQQHIELTNKINRLNEAAKQNRPTEIIVNMFDDLIAYTCFHFETEEQIMKENGYIDLAVHKLDHNRLKGEAKYLRKKIIEGGELLALQYIKDWLLPHILHMDKPMASFLLQLGADEFGKN